MLDLENQPCPICGQTQSSLFHQTTYPEQHYPGDFVLRRCTGCSLLFNSPRLDDQALAGLYGSNYYFFRRGDARELERIVGMYQRTVRLVEDNINPKRSIDIGCGRGYFPVVQKHLGWDARGIEISSDAAQYGRDKFSLDIFTGTVEQYAASSQSQKFPLVTAIDVIEHVPRPDEFVAAACSIVESSGYLLIDTPNAAAKNISLKGVLWKGFNPFHIYLFTIDNLTTLLARHGMKVEQSFSYGNSNEPINMRDRLAGTFKAIGLMGPAAKLYFAMQGLTGGGGDPAIMLSHSVSQIRSGKPYSSTPDASAPLASSKMGDNIVLIARKS